MPYRLQQKHWTAFATVPFVEQGVFGRKPCDWAMGFGIDSLDGSLPTQVLTRAQVREECQNPAKSVLHGYICVMAWGLQGAAGRRSHVVAAWANRVEIARRLSLLKAGGYSRRQAYELFATDPIPGLGPSYFTKLIFFFRPEAEIGYIMDQWSGKSINLITGHHVVRMYGDSPAATNTAENFDSYCRVIDFLANQTGNSGDELEQRLFSQNGLHRRPRGAWRDHVRAHWAADKPIHGYDRQEMIEWVRELTHNVPIQKPHVGSPIP
ncbi:hypothetical protein PQR11_20470 [Paraburkholderia strydomiana]|uniref:8-oxoguanine DNA glycosylase OGG fold protein n=1 Tax=Paraburkholderia strydomiana TaxID=1245417 RepID=UPI0038B7F0A3